MKDLRHSSTQKLLKITGYDDLMLRELTMEAVRFVQEESPQLLPHELPTSSHVLRLLLRRGFDELQKIKKDQIKDTSLITDICNFGGMKAPFELDYPYVRHDDFYPERRP